MSSVSDAAYPLARCDAEAVLTEWVKQNSDVALCDSCHGDMRGTTFIICKNPPMDGLEKTYHHGHTACEKCVKTLDYVGDKGRCVACIREAGGTRSRIMGSGLALQPPIENVKASAMIQTFRDAEHKISEAQEAAEQARIQEGADRRAAAVEEARSRREERERLALEDAQKKAAEAEKMAAEAESHREAMEARASAAEAAAKHTERESRRREQEAREQVEKEAQTRVRAAEARAQQAEAMVSRKRKSSPPMLTAKRQEAMAKAKATRDAKKNKLEEHPRLVQEVDALRELLRKSENRYEELKAASLGDLEVGTLDEVLTKHNQQKKDEEFTLSDDDEASESEETPMDVQCTIAD